MSHGDLSTLHGASDREPSLPAQARAQGVRDLAFRAWRGLAALLVMSLVDPHGQMAFDGILLVGGALAGIGLDPWLRG